MVGSLGANESGLVTYEAFIAKNGTAENPFPAGEEFKTYRVESVELHELLNQLCKGSSKFVPAMFGDGEMYGFSSRETVKVFLNQTAKGAAVKDLKIMWDDYHGGSLYHAHQGHSELSVVLIALLKRYAPDLKTEVFAAFFESEARVFETTTLRFELKITKHKLLVERLIIVTPKE